jgi:hypothetical protein
MVQGFNVRCNKIRYQCLPRNPSNHSAFVRILFVLRIVIGSVPAETNNTGVTEIHCATYCAMFGKLKIHLDS